MKKFLLFATILLQIISFQAIAQQGQTLNFSNTANTNVALSNNIQLLDSFTIEAWIYPEQKADFSTIIGNKSPGIANPGYFLAVNNYATSDGKIIFETQNKINVTVNSVVWNQWQHIAIAWNGSLVRIYINGAIQQLDDSLAMNLQTSNSPCYLGDIPAYVGNGNFFGNMDELRVWNYARTQQELQSEMYCQLSQTQPGLTVYYQFNEGIAGAANNGVNTLPDFSGNNNTATLNNFGLNGASANWIAPGGVASNSFTQTLTACVGTGITVGGNVYTTDGIYYDTLAASNGCDSVVTTEIFFNLADNIDQSFIICAGDSIVVGTSVYNNAGSFTDNFVNANGCDSIINTTITINVPNTNVTQVGNTLNAEIGATSYQWVICDFLPVVLPNENNVSFSPSIDGIYSVFVTQGACTAQSSCYPIILTGLNENNKLSKLNVLPNLAQEFVFLLNANSGNYSISTTQGQILKTIKVANTIEKIDISELPAGMYFISNRIGQVGSFVKN